MKSIRQELCTWLQIALWANKLYLGIYKLRKIYKKTVYLQKNSTIFTIKIAPQQDSLSKKPGVPLETW